jgi:hypothetical protein
MRAFLPLLVLSMAAGATVSSAQPSPKQRATRDTTRVVFVCEHGSVKSMIAAALFNRLATERGLASRAVSRGTVPDSAIPQLVRDGLRAEGADLGNIRPIGFSAADARGTSMFVVFDVELPRIGAGIPVRRWDATPSVMQSYPTGRDAIASRVATLVAELERAAPSPASASPRRPKR